MFSCFGMSFSFCIVDLSEFETYLDSLLVLAVCVACTLSEFEIYLDVVNLPFVWSSFTSLSILHNVQNKLPGNLLLIISTMLSFSPIRCLIS